MEYSATSDRNTISACSQTKITETEQQIKHEGGTILCKKKFSTFSSFSQIRESKTVGTFALFRFNNQPLKY